MEFLVILCFTAALSACASLQYEAKGSGYAARVRGVSTDPAGSVMALSFAERQSAEAQCIRTRGVAGCYYGSFGLVPPEEQAWAQFVFSSPLSQLNQKNQQDDMQEIQKNIAQIKNSQRLLIKAMRTDR
jgi:hypothetical protein